MSSILWSYKPAKEKKEKPVERGKEEDVPSALDSDRSYAYKGKGRKGRKVSYKHVKENIRKEEVREIQGISEFEPTLFSME